MRQERWEAAAFDAAPAAMFGVDGEGRIAFANLEAARRFGRPRDDLAGTAFAALIAADHHPAMRAALARALAAPPAPAPAREELDGLDETGARFPIEVCFGRLAGSALAVAVIRDLGEQRRAAAAVALDARERLEAMLSWAPAFIISVNRRGTIDFINRTLPQYTKADVIGMSWLAFFPPDQVALMERKLAAMYASDSTQMFETSTAGPDGRTLWFETQIAPLRGAGGIIGAVLVAQDVTERKLAQAELLANRHMALLGTLAAGVAHEINTPIQFVRDSIQFLDQSTTDLIALIDALQRLRRDARDGQPLAPIVAAAARAEADADLPYLREHLPPAFKASLDGLNQIAKIVRSLKDFARVSGEEMAPADLNRVVQSALNIATNECRFVADVETDLGELPPITCHASEIGQVVLNIVVNAAHAIADVVKGTARRGRITVATRYEADAALITISDTGAGIAPAIQSRIFDPFFTTKEVGRGSGQGLSIAWSMVKERHRGTLTFATEPGKGTTFTVRLPSLAAAA